MADGYDDLLDELTAVSGELALLGERVLVLEQGAPGPGGADSSGRTAGAPVHWDNLPADERTALWVEFVAWVAWLSDRYELTTDQLPRGCWWRHGAVVEELTALWTSHTSAYGGDEDVGAAPYLWQDALSRAIERIGRHWLGPCRNGQHRDRHRTPWSGDEPYLTPILAITTQGATT
ncbi:hypothetical protein ACFV5N_00730 [Streptomyces sp. NPDC059853]|uniref:hypothetical protein n=1 Tax=Streptomyces sp. NPDC059853 TaxID=3346973 RepID=UPI00364ACC13